MDTERLTELIHEIRIAMLTTVEPDGHIRSRPMATIAHRNGYDGTIWFFTSQSSPKIVEVQEDPRVNLSYCDPSRNRYVSISGTCELVRDRAKAREFWHPMFKAWFPQGLDDPELALIRVTVEEAEYWDAPKNTMVRAVGLIKALRSGERYESGPHERMKVG